MQGGVLESWTRSEHGKSDLSCGWLSSLSPSVIGIRPSSHIDPCGLGSGFVFSEQSDQLLARKTGPRGYLEGF